jgi:hypothetical protein
MAQVSIHLKTLFSVSSEQFSTITFFSPFQLDEKKTNLSFTELWNSQLKS